MFDSCNEQFSLAFGPLKVVWYLRHTPGYTMTYAFECYRFVAGRWQPLKESYYETELTVDASRKLLIAASWRILEILEDAGVGYDDVDAASYAEGLELLSWMDAENFNLRCSLESRV